MKKGPDGALFNLTGAPGEIRTPDLLVRSQTQNLLFSIT
jgi:hypothetical protein